MTLGLWPHLFTTQFDGSPYASGNCNMAAGAMLLFEVQTGRFVQARYADASVPSRRTPAVSR